MLESFLVSLHSKKQAFVALSITKLKYIVIGNCHAQTL